MKVRSDDISIQRHARVLHGQRCKGLASPRKATAKTTYNRIHQPKLPSIRTIHRPSTGHHRQSSPRVKARNTHEHVNNAHHRHTKPWPAAFPSVFKKSCTSRNVPIGLGNGGGGLNGTHRGAVRLCVGVNSDGWLREWDFCEFVLIRSSSLWRLPFENTGLCNGHGTYKQRRLGQQDQVLFNMPWPRLGSTELTELCETPASASPGRRATASVASWWRLRWASV